ncbi:RusA family crossover junction endodeoxyribonuclease [Bacillus sp. B-jedd]|uniref:RusA family crossover junction endodeoxyribonuclease n=1 Tax=Bacillus sp. B-jedd TaxID=1476857 RepID=UPI00051556A7|nr:RusA family crossover junction endodeoxyribonuclease [Bacillus sp. B-jedd]CEG29593.1 phage-like protein [Bacillus sp. B-jedd]
MGINLSIPIEPMGAVRMTQRGKFTSRSALKYLGYKDFIKLHVKNGAKGTFFTDGPIEVTITFHMPIPASWSKKRRAAAAGIYHIKKPDADNLVKGVFDSLNGIIWKDDNQVAKVTATKLYGKTPKIEVFIRELE